MQSPGAARGQLRALAFNAGHAVPRPRCGGMFPNDMNDPQADPEPLYDAFVSYATDPDYRLVRELEVFLETFHETPTPSGIALRALHICVDGSDFTLPKTAAAGEPGEELPRIIESYLASSRYLLVVASRGARQSSWVRQEVEWFLSNRPKDRILLAVSQGYDPGATPDEVFPEPLVAAGLHRKLWYDLRGANPQQAQHWLKVRDLDDNRVRLAADLQGVRAGDVLPSWYRAKELAEARERARRRLDASRRLALVAHSLLPRQVDVALLLGVEALNLGRTVEARRFLYAALARHPRLERLLQSHGAGIGDARFLPDMRRLISVDGGRLLVWDLDAGRIVAEGSAAEGGGSRLSMSTDGQELAVAGLDHRIRIYSIEQGLSAPRLVLDGHADRIRDLAFSADGRRLVSCSFDKTIRIWDTATGRPQRAPIVEPASAVAFTLDSARVLFARNDFNLISSDLEDNGIYVLDIDSATPMGTPMLWHRTFVHAMAVDDARRLLVSADGGASIWNLASRTRSEPAPDLHRSWILSAALSRDGQKAATGSEDRTVQVWSTESRTPVAVRLDAHAAPVHAVCFDDSATRLASGSSGGELFVWNLAAESHLRTAFARHPEVAKVVFSPDGRWIASCGNDSRNSIVLWDAGTGAQVAVLHGHTDNVTDVAFHPEGDVLASCSWDASVRCWSVPQRGPIGPPRVVPQRCAAISFSPDGQRLAVACREDEAGRAAVLLLSVGDTLSVIQSLDHAEDVTDVAFHPDGNLLATATRGEVQLWDLSQPPARGTVLACPGFVHAVTFSDGGSTLCAATSLGQLHQWSVASLEEVAPPLRAQTLPIFALAFRPDDAMFATGAADGAVVLWDTASRAVIADRLDAGGDSVVAADFSRDGSRLAVASSDGLITLWDVCESSWAAKARRIANRELSKSERVTYTDDVDAATATHDIVVANELPAWIDIDRNQGTLRGKASDAWQEFEAARARLQAQVEHAETRQTEAAAHARRGDAVEAMAAFDDAATILRDVATEWPNVRLKLAGVLLDRGVFLLDDDRLEPARASLAEAGEIASAESRLRSDRRRETARPRPDADELHAVRIWTWSEIRLGECLYRLQETAAALAHLNRTLDAGGELTQWGAALSDQEALTTALSDRGQVFEALDDPESACRDYQRAAAVIEESLEREEKVEWLRRLVNILRMQGAVARRSSGAARAVEIYAEMERYATRVYGDTGDHRDLRDLAFAVSQRADCLHEAMGPAEACDPYDSAVEALSSLVQAGAVDLRPELAKALDGRCRANRDRGNVDAALMDNERSVAVWSTVESAGDLASAWMTRCHLLDRAGRTREALVACDRALQATVAVGSSQQGRALYLVTQSRLRLQCDDAAGAAASAAQAIALLEGCADLETDRTLRADLGRAFASRARAHEASHDPTSAVADYGRALGHLDATAASSQEGADSDGSAEAARIANTLAWILATSRRPEVRDGPRAVALAQRACEHTSFQCWQYLDTLAAALARNGDFARACEIQQQAISLAPENEQASMAERLATYGACSPFADNAGPDAGAR